MQTIRIKTQDNRQIIDITHQVQDVLNQSDVNTGLCNVFVTHTTAAIGIADLDPGGTDLDYLDALEQIVPHLNYRHPHDPSHMPDHILATLVGPSVTVPAKDGQLVLGAWQAISLFEFSGPRERQIFITFISSQL